MSLLSLRGTLRESSRMHEGRRATTTYRSRTARRRLQPTSTPPSRPIRATRTTRQPPPALAADRKAWQYAEASFMRVATARWRPMRLRWKTSLLSFFLSLTCFALRRQLDRRSLLPLRWAYVDDVGAPTLVAVAARRRGTSRRRPMHPCCLSQCMLASRKRSVCMTARLSWTVRRWPNERH